MINKAQRIQQIIINPSTSVIDAMKKMDELDIKLMLVAENNILPAQNIISIGDIQRAIIKQIDLKKSIVEILRGKIRVCNLNDSPEHIKNMMLEHRAEFMPLVDDAHQIVDVIFWEERFDDDHPPVSVKLDIPVVIMAGGKGSRLKPITNIIPKPLVPIGDKPIIEVIIDQFNEIGVNSFYISVNYKAEMIQSYFSSLPNKNYFLSYFEEKQPLGTAGSLYLLKEKIHSTFFVTNCDIIINHQLDEIYKFHKENNFELTVVGALKSFSIPYGTISYESGGILTGLEEKPEMTFVVNTGMYVLEPELINEIPENKFFHITSLIENIIARGGKVGVFPVSEGSWMDIGEWKEYDRTQAIYNNKIKKK